MFRAFSSILALMLGLTLGFVPQAVAEQRTAKNARKERMLKYYRSLPPAKRKEFLKRMRDRRLASRGSNDRMSAVRAQRQAPAAEKAVELDLNLLLGFSFIAGSESDDAQELTAQSDQSMNAAIDAHARFLKYMGLEIDAQFGLPSSQESQQGNDALFTQIRRRSASAAMLNLNGEIPIRSGASTFTPKLGIGYGALFVKDETSFATEGEDVASDSATTTLSGGYWTVGLEAQIGANWRAGADFAMGVTPSGKTGFSSDGANLRLQDAAFNRIRLGVSYQVTPKIRLGAQFIRRSLSYVFPIQDGTTVLPFNVSIDQNHTMALIGFDL